MQKIAEITKVLSALNPQGHPARLALLNYLNALPMSTAPFDAEILQNFIAYCLDYPHWQQNKSELAREIRSVLSLLREQGALDLGISNVRLPDQLQIIDIQNDADFTDALQVYLRATLGDLDFRLIPDQKKVFALILRKDRSLEVRKYDRKFLIQNGQLEPLRQDLCLHYRPDLELCERSLQNIEIAPFVSVHFRGPMEQVSGVAVRGYLCQKSWEFRDQPLQSFPKLFLSLKHIEQLFISRESDAFYQGMVSEIEKSLTLLRLRDATGAMQATQTLLQAQTCLEAVFTGDKLLGLLVRDLERQLAEYGPIETIRPIPNAKERVKTWEATNNPRNQEFELTN